MSGFVTSREPISFLKAQVRPKNSGSKVVSSTALTGEIVPTPSTFAIADAFGVRVEL